MDRSVVPDATVSACAGSERRAVSLSEAWRLLRAGPALLRELDRLRAELGALTTAPAGARVRVDAAYQCFTVRVITRSPGSLDPAAASGFLAELWGRVGAEGYDVLAVDPRGFSIRPKALP